MNWLATKTFRRTTLATIVCLALLIGIGLAHQGYTLPSTVFLVAIIPALLSLRHRNGWAIIWLIVIGLSIGHYRGEAYMQKLADYEQYFGQTVTITAVAKRDASYNKFKQLTFDANDVVIQSTGQQLTGKVSIGGFGENAIFAGDKVTVTGKLRPARGSYQARMSYAQLEVTQHGGTVIDDLRRRFTAGTQSALPEPMASFGMGLLVGQRNNLPEEVSHMLVMVGLTHIIAVSGYNLTILLRSAEKISGKRSKRLTTAFAFGLIIIFLLFAGDSASIVRAAIVSTLSIAAGYYGRSFKPLLLLLFTAAITAYASPFYLWSDLGWYLSFLAFFGVMILSPLLSANWSDRYKNSVILAIALESLCAEIMTLPLILHFFGQMSFINLVANVLVVGLIPLAMLLSLIAGLAGMLFESFVGWFAFPARILLTYMLDVVRLLSSIPHVFVENLSFSLLEMIISYVVIIVLCLALWWKRKTKTGTITDENAVARMYGPFRFRVARDEI